MKPEIQHFYHAASGTFSYVVSDPSSGSAAIIDPVLGYSAASGRTDTTPAEAIISYVKAKQLTVEWILETHAHADHLTAAQFLKSRLGGKVAIGQGIRDVQAHFGPIFNLQKPFAADGHQFDQLFGDNETFLLGALTGKVLQTPGHTSDSVTYVFANAAFVGDTLFNSDSGTARCDFPGGDSGVLFDSVQKLFALPADTEFYLCHDYPSDGRALRYKVPIAEQKTENIHVRQGTSREEFIAMRDARDATLSLPALLLPAIQVNIRAGQLPPPDDNAIAYIKIPLDTL
jgi:glyoxylase-like metal-dependent hydrolase (beta-lactamase superfamily II)